MQAQGWVRRTPQAGGNAGAGPMAAGSGAAALLICQVSWLWAEPGDGGAT
jgi:hypothetical protein